MVGMGFRQITDRFQIGFFLIYSSTKAERLSAKWLNEQQPSLRASAADSLSRDRHQRMGFKAIITWENFQSIVGLLKKIVSTLTH